MKKTLFIVAGLLASIGTLFVVDRFTTNSSHSLLVSYGLMLVSYTLALAVGGAVAGRIFRTPAVALVLLSVVGLVFHTAYLAGEFGQPVLPVLVNNLPIIVIAVTSAIVGSNLGAWFAECLRRYFGSAT